MDPAALLTIGKVTSVHGLKGNLKIWSFAESIDTFAPDRKVWLKSEDEETGTSYTVMDASPRNKGVVIRLKEVDRVDLAEALVGKDILIPRTELPALEEDVWYWEDLYGLTVIDQELGHLGIIETIFSTPAHDILVVTGKEQNKAPGQIETDEDLPPEILIPMHDHFIESVDLEAKIVRTTLPGAYLS